MLPTDNFVARVPTDCLLCLYVTSTDISTASLFSFWDLHDFCDYFAPDAVASDFPSTLCAILSDTELSRFYQWCEVVSARKG